MDSVDLYNDVARESRTWKVRMPDGGTTSMTVDELDAAFDRSEIGLTTLVQRPSGGEWRTLGEAAGVDDSIRPVSSDFELFEIPKPPPLPRSFGADLAVEEPIVRTKRSGRRLAAVAVLGLLIGGVAAWRYMPAKPVGALATTTILAPRPPAAAAAPEAAAEPEPAAEPTPAPHVLAEQTIIGSAPNTTNTLKAHKTLKSTGKPKAKAKATTWKQRLKLHAKAKKNA